MERHSVSSEDYLQFIRQVGAYVADNTEIPLDQLTLPPELIQGGQVLKALVRENDTHIATESQQLAQRLARKALEKASVLSEHVSSFIQQLVRYDRFVISPTWDTSEYRTLLGFLDWENVSRWDTETVDFAHWIHEILWQRVAKEVPQTKGETKKQRRTAIQAALRHGLNEPVQKGLQFLFGESVKSKKNRYTFDGCEFVFGSPQERLLGYLLHHYRLVSEFVPGETLHPYINDHRFFSFDFYVPEFHVLIEYHPHGKGEWKKGMNHIETIEERSMHIGKSSLQGAEILHVWEEEHFWDLFSYFQSRLDRHKGVKYERLKKLSLKQFKSDMQLAKRELLAYDIHEAA